MAVKDGLEVYGREYLHKGDVIVCNHAAVQGQHLNNTVMYTPVFAGPKAMSDRILRRQLSLDRHRRLGHRSVSYSSPIFSWRGCSCARSNSGRRRAIEEVYRIIENNTRFPLELLGDIEAQLGGCLLGAI